MRYNPRQIALQGLLEVDSDPRFCEEIIEKLLKNAAGMPDRDKRLTRELILGTLRWESALGFLLDKLTRSRPQKPKIRWILILGLYQIFYLTRIPGHAAVSESVQLTRSNGAAHASGFVNAMLRQALRSEKEFRDALSALKNEDPATAFSHPDWLVEKWIQREGLERTLQLLEWNNQAPSTFARLRPGWEAFMDQEGGDLFESLDPETLSRLDWVQPEEVALVKSSSAWRSSNGFTHGKVYIQDPSTLLAPRLLNPQPGDLTLDVCSAPGGKSAVLWDLMKENGTLILEDLPGSRMNRLQENLERLGLMGKCEIQPADPDPSQTGLNDIRLYDKILIDAPCSNTGVLRRRIDLRRRIQPDSVDRLRTLQKALVIRSAARLKPGGQMVYSTCSLEPDENQQVTEWFGSQFPDFTLLQQRQLTPVDNQVDGAYAALWFKNTKS
jgi:16S rRNA (cytosine967-C5)-methyltransferase